MSRKLARFYYGAARTSWERGAGLKSCTTYVGIGGIACCWEGLTHGVLQVLDNAHATGNAILGLFGKIEESELLKLSSSSQRPAIVVFSGSNVRPHGCSNRACMMPMSILRSLRAVGFCGSS